MADQNKRLLVNIVTSLITSFVVLAGAWLTFQGDLRSSEAISDSNRLESAFDRISYLETEMKQQQAKANTRIVELTSQVFRLQSQLNKNLNVLDLFDDFMESLPFEAWLKEVEVQDNGETNFKMLLINKRYELVHGISDSRYEGQPDSEVWDKQTSQQFRESDLKVVRSKSSIVKYTTYPLNPQNPNGEQVNKLIVKIYLDLVEGRVMVFGMAIDIPETALKQQ